MIVPAFDVSSRVELLAPSLPLLWARNNRRARCEQFIARDEINNLLLKTDANYFLCWSISWISFYLFKAELISGGS